MRYLLITFAAMTLTFAPQAQSASDTIHHTVVIKESGRFSGWPANHGIWSWGNEIVVGFQHGYYKENPTGGHAIDRDRPSENKMARSLDGGETWTIETPTYADRNKTSLDPATIEGGIDFSNPDLALRFSGGSFHYSLDRCHTWQGPYTLPTFGRPGLLCRTDYIVEGKDRVTAFIAAEKDGGEEGQPLCIRTTDGGRTWNLVGWIGQQPPATYGYAIMPATIALKDGGYLSIIRRGGVFDGQKRWWLEAFLSPDDGHSWYMLDQPRIDTHGNPATLTRLDSGEIAMTYGWRSAPYGIRARISKDEGQTWDPEIILRCDGASWDLGYPRTVQRPDGKCVTVYYFHHPDQPERYIGCTIWDPNADYDN
ncbi:MAG TPA: sialidase family protein [bacterium]|nr:sialidase family protein [bacterium]